jgi:hypothetical protein
MDLTASAGRKSMFAEAVVTAASDSVTIVMARNFILAS